MTKIQIDDLSLTDEDCHSLMEKIRWKGTVTCVYCKSNIITKSGTMVRFHCNTCNTSFSATVGTAFHQTHLPLQKWFFTIAVLLLTREQPSVRKLGTVIGVTKDTAARMIKKITDAMTQPEQRKLLTDLAGTEVILAMQPLIEEWEMYS